HARRLPRSPLFPYTMLFRSTTAEAYRLFVRVNGLEEIIRSALDDLEAGRAELSDVGRRIREAMLRGEWPEALADAIVAAYRGLGDRKSPRLNSSHVKNSYAV